MYSRMVRELLLLILISSLPLSLVACNTMQGVGKDMEAAGEAIEKKAREKKGY